MRRARVEAELVEHLGVPLRGQHVADRVGRWRPTEGVGELRGNGGSRQVGGVVDVGRHLHGQLPPACTIIDLGDRPELPPAEVLATARTRGGSMVLTEGGPRLLGQLAVGGLLDELFLTISPVLAGRGDTARPGLIAGLELLPGRREPAELLTVRRHGSCVFLRYAMRGKDTGVR